MAKETKKDEASPVLIADLLFDQQPRLDPAAVAARVTARLPRTRMVSGSEKSIMFAHEDHRAEFAGGQKVPPQLVVIPSDGPPAPERLGPSVQQTWNWPAGKQQAARYRHAVVVMEMMAITLPHKDRVRLFTTGLLAVAEALDPLGVHVHHAQRLLDPSALRAAASDEDPLAMFMCNVNVRLFRIENAAGGAGGGAGDIVMDTRGLSALRLPDLQMHFRNLDPGEVGGHLFNVARYVYDQGDCISDGETIGGLGPDDKWRCRHEMSLVGPERIVLDIDPGPPNAAGGRAS